MAGLLEWLGFRPSGDVPVGAPTRTASPWTSSQLSQVVMADIFGTENMPVTRALAMRVPAVAKARALIVGPLSRQPLTVLDDNGIVPNAAPWLQRTAGVISPWHRMAWTLDDCLFHGRSLWAVVRDPFGAILAAQRIPFDRWRITEAGVIEVYTADGWGEPGPNEVIYFDGPQEGLLDLASDTIRGAIAIDKAWVERAKSPIPLIELHQLNDEEIEQDEAEAWVAAVVEKLQGPAAKAVTFTDRRIELKTHGDTRTDMFVEGRNALTLDIARFAALPGSLLDASMATASLTYSTSEGKRNELIDYSLSFWADAIAGRLSQDDVVPMGQRVRFDMTEFTATVNTPTGPTTKD